MPAHAMDNDQAPHWGQLDVGDRVCAVHHLGLFRHRVRSGTQGVVTGHGPDATLRVRFDNGKLMDVDPTDLDLAT